MSESAPDRWTNEPPSWKLEGGVLTVKPAGDTDLWRNTIVPGKTPDNLHVLGRPVRGNFLVEARLTGDFRHQYDQAGLLVRQDGDNWLKVGVELLVSDWDGRFHVKEPTRLVNGAYTRGGWSEWSVVPPMTADQLHSWIRIERLAETCIVSYSYDGSTFHFMKVCAFPDADALEVGRFIGAPTQSGYTATIDRFRLEAR
jgi:regulation of enolase protein 1 (concanavalin A-like superfamily)